MSKSHFVLVHGAYHRAWHLSHLKAELQAFGYTVSDVDLPAAGETCDQHVNDGLVADTAAVLAAVEEAASKHDNIALVFHSYGGVPGGEAAAQLSPTAASKVKHMIYLAAFVLRAGNAATTRSGGKTAPWSTRTEDNKFVYVPDPVAPFYHDVEPGLAKEAAARVTRHAASSFNTPTKAQGWELFPTTYIFCKEDRAMPIAVQKVWFDLLTDEERKGWRFETLDCGHSPFLSKPAECAKLLAKIVGDTA